MIYFPISVHYIIVRYSVYDNDHLLSLIMNGSEFSQIWKIDHGSHKYHVMSHWLSFNDLSSEIMESTRWQVEATDGSHKMRAWSTAGKGFSLALKSLKCPAYQHLPSNVVKKIPDAPLPEILGEFHHDLTTFSRSLGTMVKEIIPKCMAKLFRSVN